MRKMIEERKKEIMCIVIKNSDAEKYMEAMAKFTLEQELLARIDELEILHTWGDKKSEDFANMRIKKLEEQLKELRSL